MSKRKYIITAESSTIWWDDKPQRQGVELELDEKDFLNAPNLHKLVTLAADIAKEGTEIPKPIAEMEAKVAGLGTVVKQKMAEISKLGETIKALKTDKANLANQVEMHAVKLAKQTEIIRGKDIAIKDLNAKTKSKK